MKMTGICPCVKLDCSNHGNCEKCISNHLRKGSLNYCGFYTVLPDLQEAIKASPESPTAQKLTSMIDNRLEIYDTLTAKHSLNNQEQEQLLKKKAGLSNY